MWHFNGQPEARALILFQKMIFIKGSKGQAWALHWLSLQYLRGRRPKWHLDIYSSLPVHVEHYSQMAFFFSMSHELIWSMTVYYYLSWMDTFRNFSYFLKTHSE